VINIDSLMSGALCGKLHRPPSHLLLARQQVSIDSQRFVQNRDMCLSHLHSTPPLGGPRRNITMTFGTKTRLECLPGGEKSLKIGLRLLVLTEFTNVTDRRTRSFFGGLNPLKCGSLSKPPKGISLGKNVSF